MGPSFFLSKNYRPVLNPDSEEHKYTLKGRLYKYLMGLNSEYETLVNQILARVKVPNFEEALKLVVREESTWNLRSDLKINPESAAFAARRGKDLQVQPVSKDQKEGKQRYVKGDPNTDPKAHLFCTNCKKHRHTVETCWDIHGKPKTYGKSNVAATSGDSEERTKNIPKNPHPPGPLIHPIDLNQEKYVKLQEELETLRL